MVILENKLLTNGYERQQMVIINDWLKQLTVNKWLMKGFTRT